MKKKRHKNDIKPFPAYVYIIAVLGLTMLGIGISIYLTVSHYRIHTDIGYSSFCAISKAINCDTVSQSPYSVFWGVPVPVWGIIGYLFLLSTVLSGWNHDQKKLSLLSTLLLIAFLSSCISISLALLSTFIIHSYCMMCVVTYGINFALLFMTWLIKQRFGNPSWKLTFKEDLNYLNSNKTRAVTIFIPALVITALALVSIPDYWNYKLSEQNLENLEKGFTEDGSPWIGSSQPELTIIEYADYMCFQCKKMHFYLRSLAAQYPGKIKIIHKHFPMDQKVNPLLTGKMHPGSGILSAIAIHASDLNKFWELNDYLYKYDVQKKNLIHLRTIAKETGLDLDTLRKKINSEQIKFKLRRDIVHGLKDNVTGTPSYLINDKLYSGQIPPEILKVVTK